MFSRRQFLAVSGLAAAAVSAQPQARSHPNIVFLLADDLGYGDVGCYGQQQLLTPNIDRLATQGTRFTQAYAGATVCAPSRCALMTGLHNGHAWIRGNKNISLRKEDTTFPELLQRAGYHTGIFGKWGLGDAGQPGVPNAKGFDDWFGYLNQTHAHNYFPEHLWENNTDVLLKENWGNQKKTYSHDLVAQHTMKFLDNAAAKQQPFFLFGAFTLPHANNEALQYSHDGMEVPNDAPFTDKSWPQTEKNFAAMVKRLDDTVGAVLGFLEKNKLADNTLVIFSSDNGPHQEGKHDPKFFHSSGPLRGIKRDLYEGGIRVPFIARWPGKIKAGATSEQVLAFYDLMPTFCELAGASVPSGIDGISMVPALLGQPLSQQRQHEYLYWEFHEGGFNQAIRFGDGLAYKAIRFGPDGPIELYDLRQNIGESQNLAGVRPELVAKAKQIFATARVENPEFPMQTQAANSPSRGKDTSR